MTFTLKLNNGRILKGLIETLASIIDETEIEVTPNHFTIVAMDPSRICLLKFSMKKENFDIYKCSKKVKIGINLSDLDKIMKRSGAKDSISISFNTNEQKIKIQMQREGISRKRTFSLMLLDIDVSEVPIDNLLKIEYQASWSMEPALLVESIKDAEIYSEILNIEANEGEGLKFSSFGQIGEMVYDLPKEDLIESEFNSSSKGAYSITFLKAILKLISVTKKLEIKLKTDHPLQMNFKLVDGGELDYFLAPRVEEAEFDDDDDFDDF